MEIGEEDEAGGKGEVPDGKARNNKWVAKWASGGKVWRNSGDLGQMLQKAYKALVWVNGGYLKR